MALKAKVLEYAVSIDRDGTAENDRGDEPLGWDEAWSAEHLVLAGLCRCTLTSLRYHARLANVQTTATASASGVVTKRPSDGRYAFVEVDIALDVEVEPPLDDDGLRALLAKAERDCFIGASLTAAPRYRWTVEGEEIA